MRHVYVHVTSAFKTYVVALALAGGLTEVSSARQKPPSFAGVWELVNIIPPPKDAAPNALKPEPVTIRHTATSFEIVDETRTMKFTIGGPKPDVNRTGAAVWTTTTRWEGAALVTTGTIAQTTTAGYQEWKFTETRTLDARGRMVVARKQVALDGSVWTGTVEWAKSKSKESRP